MRLAVLAALCTSTSVHAQIATDGTLGAVQSFNGIGTAIPASLGQQRGASLFHSFAAFSVPTGGSAMFTGPASVGNVISRVTGADPSSIDGRLGTTIAGANLFLVNPRGIVFGPNASLDLTGSFFATTANYVRLADGTRFEATATTPAVLTSAAPEAFGFLGPSAAPITLAPGAQLIPPTGASVSLVGGPIAMTGAVVLTTAGDARLVATQGAGEVTLDGVSGAGLSGAPITISGGGVVAESTLDAAPGRIVIRGGALAFDDASVISNNFSPLPAPCVEIAGSGDVRFSGGQLLSIAQDAGRGADIVMRGEDVRIDGASWVQATTLGGGRAGDVDLAARGQLAIVELPSDPDRTIVAAQTQGDGDGGDLRLAGDTVLIDGAFVRNRTFGAGNSGVLSIEGRNIDVLNGASVAAGTLPGSTGAGGGMRVRATERFRIAGSNAFGDAAYVFGTTEGTGEGGPMSIQARDLVILGGYLDTVTQGAGNGGAMTIDAETVTVDALGYYGGITSLSGAAATGRAGSITIRASRSIWLGGLGYGWSTGGFGPSIISTQNVGAGEGGTILLEAPQITLDAGWIVAEGYGAGRVGSVTVRSDDLTLLRGAVVRSTRAPGATGASGNIRIEGGGTLTIGSRDATTTSPTDAEGGSAGILTADAGDSPAGSITIDMPDVYIGPASYVSSKAVGAGDAGDITIRARRMNVRGGLIISQTGVGVPTDAPGRAGAITLDVAESLEMSNLGEVPTGNSGVLSSTTTGRGDAGDVRITAQSIVLDGFLVQAATLGAGRGGRVEIRAGDLALRNGAQVSTGSQPGAPGDAGAIDVQVANRLEIGPPHAEGTPSGFSATTRGAGKGGSISISAATIEMGVDAFISATTIAQGDAGSITLTGGRLDFGEGKISTATEGAGNAGAVTIRMTERATLGGRVQSSTSGAGRGGDILIDAPDVEITAGIVSRTRGAADGGSVEVRGARVKLTGVIDSSTIGSGAAGGVTLVATERVDVTDGAGIQAETAGLEGGAGGNVRIEAPVVSIGDFAVISTRTAFSGAAGAIDIVGGDVALRGLTEVKSGTLGSGNAGAIRIRASRSIVIDDATLSSSTSGDGRGGDITLEAPSIVIAPFGTVSALSTPFFGFAGTGDGGNIYLRGDSIVVDGSIDASTYMAGRGGNIDIRGGQLTVLTDPSVFGAFGEILSQTWDTGAAGTITIDMSRGVLNRGTIATNSADIATGAGGSIFVRAPDVRLEGGGIVSATTESSAAAGRIVIEAERFSVARGSVDSSTSAGGDAGSIEIRAGSVSLTDRAFLSSSTFGDGHAGSIDIQARDVSLAGAAGVVSLSAAGADGNAGRVAIAATGSLDLGGRDTEVATRTEGSGAGGAIRIAAGRIALSDGAAITGTTRGGGAAGSVDIVSRSMSLAGGASVSSSSVTGASGNAGRVDVAAAESLTLGGAGTEIATRTEGSGAGGAIRVASADLALRDGAAIAATTSGAGAAGRVVIEADRFAAARARVDSSTFASGDAGSIEIAARTLGLLDGASVSSSSTAGATGNAGRISIAASESIALAGAGTEIATRADGTGAGGAVRVAAPRVAVSDGASITATSTGSGAAGSVEVRATDALELFGGSITTQALQSDGGNIDIYVGNRVHLRQGLISTAVGSGAGAGGNIFIDPVFFILEPGSRIAANAFGGPGGNITIIAQYFLSSPDAIIDASSRLGLSGNVSISVPRTDLSTQLKALPGEYIDPSRLLRESCGARLASGAPASSLVAVGRGGLAASPERFAASSYFGDPSSALSNAADENAPQLAVAAGQRVRIVSTCAM